MLDKWTAVARKHGASDLHLEPGVPLAMRIRGQPKTAGEPVSGQALLAAARDVIGPDLWGRTCGAGPVAGVPRAPLL
jgi:Tfp pilus assembly pilus retraction ATPase PilT